MSLDGMGGGAVRLELDAFEGWGGCPAARAVPASDGEYVRYDDHARVVAGLRDAIMQAVDGWELVANTQRGLADDKRMPLELRASMIATSNAWMTAAHDLKKLMEKAK